MTQQVLPAVAKRQIGYRLAEAVAGHSFKVIEEWIVDRTIYTLVIGYFVSLHGSVLGGLYGLAVMFPVTAVLCYLYIWAYRKLKRDLFGFELLKEAKDMVATSRVLRALQWVARRGDALVFVVLSTQKDAFMTTIYLKKDAFKPMNARDHGIFWGSLLLSNAYWAFLLTWITTAVLWIMDMPFAHDVQVRIGDVYDWCLAVIKPWYQVGLQQVADVAAFIVRVFGAEIYRGLPVGLVALFTLAIALNTYVVVLRLRNAKKKIKH